MSYEQPGGYSTPPAAPLGPPARRGRPWWVWALGGCGGCAVLVLIGSIVFGVWFAGNVNKAMRDAGPMDPASVQQRVGQDVPLYPGSTVETTTTSITAGSLRFIEQAAGKQPGAIFRGVAALITQDPPDKVAAFYDKRLKASGWKLAQARNRSSGEQQMYQKGREMVIIQTQNQPQGTMIIIMRGGSEMADKAPGQ